MRLTAEQFADLAASFEAGRRPASSEQERRRIGRLMLEAHVTVRLVEGEQLLKPVVMRVYDFSSRGIAVLNGSPLQPNRQFVVELTRQSGGCVSMLCSVRHSRQQEPGCFKIGAEFTCVLAEHPEKASPPGEVVERELKRIRDSVLD